MSLNLWLTDGFSALGILEVFSVSEGVEKVLRFAVEVLKSSFAPLRRYLFSGEG
ncbi:hypothetical protein [Endozoicomonas sp. ONNA1]|uniref:hypothetical protein n=1 Tax=Endozoicomonas sp. ONNA1 TaxID=2828740 RepID=UPI00214836A7|nr:hypothetical protein [Endozoicomonas sp. ONNA1]